MLPASRFRGREKHFGPFLLLSSLFLGRQEHPTENREVGEWKSLLLKEVPGGEKTTLTLLPCQRITQALATGRSPSASKRRLSQGWLTTAPETTIVEEPPPSRLMASRQPSQIITC